MKDSVSPPFFAHSEGREVPRVHLLHLGCAKNQVDSEIMLGLLRQAGFVLTPKPHEADLIVVNTCSFIHAAQEEAVETLLEVAQLKSQGRCRALVVTGCLSQRFGREVAEALPEVDAILGTGEVDRIVSVCRALLFQMTPARDALRFRALPPPERMDYHHALPRIRLTPRHIAYVKISEGCDRRCSFCIIPQLRGRQRSRPPEDIEVEVRRLAWEGVREVILVGQDTTAYGRDRGERDGLARLLRRLVRIPDLGWIRVLYTYPGAHTPELLAVMAGEEKICRYVDMPIQHIHDTLLRRMHRGTSRALIEKTIDQIRSRIPQVVLRTSVIVGFPGETPRRFQDLLDFLEQAAFDYVGVFTYSPEGGTPATRWADRISQKEKERRRQVVLEQQAQISWERNLARVGTTTRVLVDGPSPVYPQAWSGRTQGQAPEVDGEVCLPLEAAPPGTFVEVEITGAGPHDLEARVLTSPIRG